MADLITRTRRAVTVAAGRIRRSATRTVGRAGRQLIREARGARGGTADSITGQAGRSIARSVGRNVGRAAGRIGSAAVRTARGIGRAVLTRTRAFAAALGFGAGAKSRGRLPIAAYASAGGRAGG